MYHINIFSNELCHVVDSVFTCSLNQHLESLVGRATMNHMLLVLGRDGNLIGSHVHFVVFHIAYEFLHATCNMKFDFHVVFTSKGTNSLIIIA